MAGAAIAAGLAAWLGKVWAVRILAQAKAKFGEDLAHLKMELDHFILFSTDIWRKIWYVCAAQMSSDVTSRRNAPLSGESGVAALAVATY